MKSQQKINLLFSLIITGLIITVIVVSNNENKQTVNNKRLNNNQFRLIEIKDHYSNEESLVYGIVNAEIKTVVKMKVNGKIDDDNRSLSVGTTFQKNDILIKVDRLEVLYTLLISRLNYKNHIQESLREIEEAFPEAKNKWQQFEKNIERTLPLPELPKTTSKEEEALMNKLNVYLQYYEIKKLEQKAQNHIYAAPFDGFISESTVGPNKIVKRDVPLMTLSKINSFQVISHLPLKSLRNYETANKVYFIDNKKDTVGTGAFKRSGQLLSDSSMIEVFFTISSQNQSIQNTSVEIILPQRNNKKGVSLPESAVLDNTVFLFTDNKIIATPIKVIFSKNDSLVVSGLPNHCFVITQADGAMEEQN